MFIDNSELKWSIGILLVLLVILAIAYGEGYVGDRCGGAVGQTSAECL